MRAAKKKRRWEISIVQHKASLYLMKRRSGSKSPWKKVAKWKRKDWVDNPFVVFSMLHAINVALKKGVDVIPDKILRKPRRTKIGLREHGLFFKAFAKVYLRNLYKTLRTLACKSEVERDKVRWIVAALTASRFGHCPAVKKKRRLEISQRYKVRVHQSNKEVTLWRQKNDGSWREIGSWTCEEWIANPNLVFRIVEVISLASRGERFRRRRAREVIFRPKDIKILDLFSFIYYKEFVSMAGSSQGFSRSKKAVNRAGKRLARILRTAKY